MILPGNFIDIKTSVDPSDMFSIFNRKISKMIPKAIINAIQRIWELETLENKLYLHQEDSLFYILGKLNHPKEISSEALLLAIPTGGGKTEAFLIPVISHIHNKKNQDISGGKEPSNKINTIITYPTKALANDQANRIVEILYEVNKVSNPHQQITVGVLTGDTPKWKGYDLKNKNIIQTCPNADCKTSSFEYFESEDKQSMRCKHCGNEITFVRLTREDILDYPPDILITNLDMINYCLQSPKLRPLFKPEKLEFDLMIFDEIHLCESVFGCHTGHLLRRIESTSGTKPLYVGVSATIGNAEELASLIFDIKKEKILYLNDSLRNYLKDETDHYRYHYIITPHKWKDPDRYLQVVTTTLNVVDVLGHSIRDPHFRKTLVFSNYRQDTDNLVKYLRDQEDRYFSPYKDEIRYKLENGINNTEKRITEFVGGWYEYLRKNGFLYNQNLEVGWHRGGLEQKERLRAITRFSTCKEIKFETYHQEHPVDIMMATKTLELGIDIGDVTNVFNCSAPFTTNEYVQRAGRGGRKNDSSTITVIDPSNPLDFYLESHFEEYVIPEKRKFEDAPIIISNENITKVHLYARILEFIADILIDKANNHNEIKVEDLKELEIAYNGELIKFMEEPEIIGEIIFEKMLKNKIIFDVDGEEIKALSSYMHWFEKEHELLNVKKVEKDPEKIKKLIVDKCRKLRDKIFSEEFGTYSYLTGMRAIDNSLVPKMRGSGPVCNIMLIKRIKEMK